LKNQNFKINIKRGNQFRVTSRILKKPFLFCFVIPAEAGIQYFLVVLDSRFRGSDDAKEFFCTLLGLRSKVF